MNEQTKIKLKLNMCLKVISQSYFLKTIYFKIQKKSLCVFWNITSLIGHVLV